MTGYPDTSQQGGEPAFPRPLLGKLCKLAETYRTGSGSCGAIVSVDSGPHKAYEGELASVRFPSAKTSLRHMINRLDLGSCPTVGAINLGMSDVWSTTIPATYFISYRIAVLGCKADPRSLRQVQSAFEEAADPIARVWPEPLHDPETQLNQLLRNDLVRSCHDRAALGGYAPTTSQLAESQKWWGTVLVTDRLMLVGIKRCGDELAAETPLNSQPANHLVRLARRRKHQCLVLSFRHPGKH